MSKNFRNLRIDQSYHPGVTNESIIENFYVPVLSAATTYDRAAGYFSSRVFASAARGIAAFVERGGRMRLVTSHAFTPSDASNLSEYFDNPEFAKQLYDEFTASHARLGELAGPIAQNHTAAMCWMLAEGLLEVRVIVPTDANLAQLVPSDLEKFHPKFGVLRDGAGDRVAFAGSVNETESAWNRNIENLDVFCDWLPGQAGYVEPKVQQFERYWDGQDLDGWSCIELPSAVREKIIEAYAPEDFPDLSGNELATSQNSSNLRPYQKEAVKAWIDAGRCGFLEMATGTGKTRTASACIESTLTLGTTLVVIVVPYKHIGDQWVAELKRWDAISLGGDWKSKLADLSYQVEVGWRTQGTLVVVKNTASNPKFVQQIEELGQSFDHVLLVADEVHWLGAPSFQSALLPTAEFRLGLSATPRRYFDEVGTEVLYDYFKQTAYTFDLSAALQYRLPNGEPILCPYEYHPKFVNLTEEEMDDYRVLSQRIAAILANTEGRRELSDQLETLLIKRASISKSAANKIPALREFLQTFPQPLSQTLIYCADFQQMDEVASLLRDLRIDAQKITGEESATKSKAFQNLSEREHILKNFANGNLDVLLAIECLDEGVDIPSARLGILLASSGNEKEFIQRRGRLMRPFPGKKVANIYDFCVLPDDDNATVESLRNVELKRIDEFAADAENAREISELTAFMREEME